MLLDGSKTVIDMPNYGGIVKLVERGVWYGRALRSTTMSWFVNEGNEHDAVDGRHSRRRASVRARFDEGDGDGGLDAE